MRILGALVMGRFFAVLLGIAGALVGSQAPGFTLQYMQSLQGRVDELARVIEMQEANFAEKGYDRSGALRECRTANNLLLAFCDGYALNIDRLDYLTTHLAELEAADDYTRPLVLARSLTSPTDVQREFITSTRKQFEPAVPATVHGAVYAAGGFGVVWGLASFLFGLLGAMFGGRR